MCNYGSPPTLANSILWGNKKGTSTATSGSDIQNSRSTPTITYTTLQVAYSGSNNSTADPLFVDASNPAGADGIHRTADDGLRLTYSSPAANTGNNGSISGITTDILGSDRTQNGTVNRGAYEDLTGDCSSTNTLPTTASTTYTAYYTSIDANGWTNYCTVGEELLLSLKIGSSGAVVSASEVELN